MAGGTRRGSQQPQRAGGKRSQSDSSSQQHASNTSNAANNASSSSSSAKRVATSSTSQASSSTSSSSSSPSAPGSAAAAAAGGGGGVAASTSLTLEESLDELHFEDEFEDEWDDEVERLKEKVTRKEIKKRMRQLQRSSRMMQEKDEKEEKKASMEEGDSKDEVEAEDEDDDEEEEYNDDSDGDDDAMVDGAKSSAASQQQLDTAEVQRTDGSASSSVAPTQAKKQTADKRVWRPSAAAGDEADGEVLEYDSRAYAMLHRMKVEWPCLSFDVVPDALGAHRTRFPHAVYLVAGTQADAKNRNQLQIIKVKDLHKTKHDDDSDDTDEEEDEEGDDRADAAGMRRVGGEGEAGEESEEDSDEDALDDDPIPEVRSVPHAGSVNRVKVNPLAPHLVAAQSDSGKVAIFDVAYHLKALDAPPPSLQPPHRGAVFTWDGQKDEGYALAWSRLMAGRLVSGDCAHGLYVWEMKEGGGGWVVDPKGFKGHTASVEDVAWSPGESTVFCSVSADRTCRMWDVRMRDKSAAFIAAHRSDVNVCGWNALRQHLLATGSDDGSFKVWDLRSFKSHTPAATFTYHTQAITSLEWHPTEDSILACSSEDHSLTVWDLSLETDRDELSKYSSGPQLDDDTPPQLFFAHAGQQHIKELHFHPQIPGLIIDTAQDGLNLLLPDNLAPH